MSLAGYVERDAHDDCYRPTVMVRALSEGFDDEALVAHIAKPLLASLGVQIVWPVAVATPPGPTMMIRETTDRESPLALEQYSAGVRVPMLASAAGRAYLAFCRAATRYAPGAVGPLAAPEDRLARNRVRSSGCSAKPATRDMASPIELAASPKRPASPFRWKARIKSWRPSRCASGHGGAAQTAVEQFLPKMREVPKKIEAQFAV